MMIRRSNDRGRTRLDWLDSRHTFSFGDYYDPDHMGFGPLRVLNDDRVAAGAGFPTHAHRDMEILTYVLAGSLAHRDSLGTGSIIRPGDVQRMSAGTGIRHSEYNASAHEPVHFLQVWIVPERSGLAPGYEQKAFPAGERQGRLRLIAAADGRDGAVTLHRDVDVWATRLEPGDRVTHRLAAGRMGWLHIATGAAQFAGEALAAGDAAGFGADVPATVTANAVTEALLFDMAA
jgi:hypothetical protein